MMDMVMHGRVISKTDDYVKKAAQAQPVLGFYIGSDFILDQIFVWDKICIGFVYRIQFVWVEIS